VSSFAPVDSLVALTATGDDATALTTYTFAARGLGAADANRYILVAIEARGGTGRTISSVTIGGVAATGLSLGGGTLIEAANGSSAYVALYYANVPTGTTGDVVVTWSAAVSLCSVHVYRTIVGAGGISSITPTTTERVTNTSPSGALRQLDGSLSIPANGVLLAISAGDGMGGIYSSDYGLYKNDGLLGTSSHGFCAFRRAFVTAATAHKYGVKFSGTTGTACAMGAAVFA
jgi:hypothetical protein